MESLVFMAAEVAQQKRTLTKLEQTCLSRYQKNLCCGCEKDEPRGAERWVDLLMTNLDDIGVK